MLHAGKRGYFMLTNTSRPFRWASMHILATAAMLAGCTASTVVVRNEDASDELKAKSGYEYKEVLLIPPKEDPRDVVPKVVAGLEQMGLKVQVVDPDKPLEASQGTGFFIGASGQILTCAHVIGEEKQATITISGHRYTADVVKSDATVDLALLALTAKPDPAIAPLAFRPADRAYTMGEDVFTIGYPLSALLGESARMSKGLISATKGLHDDPSQVQVTAEIQPGNSGGPLLDQKGQVVGVIQKTVNPWRIAQATGGALPQNINFAIKNEPVLAFLKGASEPVYAALAQDRGLSLDQAAGAVAKVQAGIVEDGNRRDKLVVRLTYSSIWDIWYRFRLFALSAYDFDTQERLFTAGQGRDNMVSNEDVVISDTLAQFRSALYGDAK